MCYNPTLPRVGPEYKQAQQKLEVGSWPFIEKYVLLLMLTGFLGRNSGSDPGAVRHGTVESSDDTGHVHGEHGRGNVWGSVQ